MKIIFLHGDDSQKTYQRLKVFMNEAKKRGWEISNDSISETPSLFNKEKLIVIRDLKKITKLEVERLQRIDGTTVIYQNSAISQEFIKMFKKTDKFELVDERYDLPFLLWNFLDNFKINDLDHILATEPPEKIIPLIHSRLKDLLWVLNGKPDYPAWRIAKLLSQAKKYGSQKIETAIEDLSNLDLQSKKTKINLILSLKMVIINLLKNESRK